MKMTDQGRRLLMEREGCKLKAYKDSVGVWTIGVGHTSAAGRPPVRQGMIITQAQADTIFADDVAEFEDGVTLLLAGAPIEPHQFDAFVSLAFNIGLGAFAASTSLRKFLEGAHDHAGRSLIPALEQARRDQGAAARRAPAIPQPSTCGEGMMRPGTVHGEPLKYLESLFTHCEDACISWPFARDSKGYGQIKIGGQARRVHRIVCERFNGKPPTVRHDAAHSCGNGHLGCANGYHLRWATRKENSADRYVHGTFRQAHLTENDVLAIRALAG